MANYISPLPETKGNKINIPHFYENDQTNNMNGYITMGELDWGIPTIHSAAQAYGQNQKLKEVISNNLF